MKLSALALVCLLSACGGGSSSSESNTDNGNNNGGNGGETTETIESQLAKWLVDMADNYVVPAYTDLESSAVALQQSALTCSDSNFDQMALESIQQQWLLAFNQWQTIQWLKLGPVVDDSRFFRLQFFPDENEAVSRGVTRLLGEQDTVTVDFVTSNNVGGQGFPALELLLFPVNDSDSLINASDKDKRCEVVQAVTSNIANISSELTTAWSVQGDNYRQQFVDGTGEFTGKIDVVEEVVTIYLENLELVKDEKLLIPLATEKPGLPAIAESAISDTSLRHIKTNLQSLKDIYTAKNGHGFDDILNNFLEQTSIATQMSDALNAAISALELLSGSYTEALNNDEKRVMLDNAINALRDFRTVLTADFVQAMDLNIGFNANDGD
mgnify:CR=1 FL=1